MELPSLQRLGKEALVGFHAWHLLGNLERDRKIFEDIKRSPLEVTYSILFEVASWAVASKVFEGLSLNDLTRDWYSCIFPCSVVICS